MYQQAELFPNARRPFDLRELPASYRPDTKAEADITRLTELELIALLLGPSKTESAIDVAGRVLSLGDKLPRATVRELATITGSRRKALRLAAAVELGRRLACKPGADRPQILKPEDAARLVMEDMRRLDREEFRVILLDTRNRVIQVETVAVGTLNSSRVEPREVFKSAVRSSAATIILVHNHPSGDPTPSRDDVALTKRLIQAGELLGIEVLDHVVIGDGKFVSLKAERLI
ncbi:DNA repair protein RadC [Thermodesulfitimonas autotrophica]|uniref:DNA repair protein RadC n=1 Tax=Thermodesulfitimonas autotrophica TaxID=1894989 RepID=A0A3N5BPD2_9THEO|nr:DNA repair protein RadC [Thermodesulfitimonas autotrophica]RPF49482.1 DNA repair protein RadC [Thermodesulfitimonas autotrophica]